MCEVPFMLNVGLKMIARVLKPIFQCFWKDSKCKFTEESDCDVDYLYSVRHFDRKSDANAIKTSVLSDLQC